MLRRALLLNAAAVFVPPLVLVVIWTPDLVDMGSLGLLLAALVVAPAAAVGCAGVLLARRLDRPDGTDRSWCVAAALLAVAEVLVAVIGLAESTEAIEALCFLTIGCTALVVALAGAVSAMKRPPPDLSRS